MAPTQNTTTSEATVSPADAKCCRCGGTFLPITRRGAFFQDAFFSNVHQHFDEALKQVLSRWNDADVGLQQTSLLDRYRRLRSLDLKEENQAVTITSDDASHKVVVDVHDFLGGDVEVKVVGEEELVVEGRVDKKEGGGATSHSFRRRFVLPRQTDMSAITSVMSSDGVLTVTVPKKESDHQKTTIIPVKVEGTKQNSQENISATKESQNGCQHCCRGTTKKIATNLCNEKSLKKETHSSESQAKSSVSSDSKEVSHSFSGHIFLPIAHRGLFFDDSFFQESWKDFQKAMKDVLGKWDEKAAIGDDLTRYRRLRSRDLKEENQAVASSEDEHHHKFVVDVKDFLDGGEVSVKAAERELVVEGRKETKEDGSKTSKRFLKRFVIPGDTQLGKVTPVVSSDGVLTISAPKKEPTLHLREVSVPISIEGRQQKSGDASLSNSSIKNEAKELAQDSTVKGNEPQTDSHVSNAMTGTLSKSIAKHGAQENSSSISCDSTQKDASRQTITAIPVRIQEEENKAETVSSSLKTRKPNLTNEDASVGPTSGAVKAKASGDSDNREGEELYQLKGNGAKFPIKINGSVINTSIL